MANDFTDIFEDVNYEEISYCDTEDTAGGLAETEIYYIPIRFVEFLKTPSVVGSFAEVGTVANKIVCKKNYGFKKLKALMDTADLAGDLQGSIGRKRPSGEIGFTLLGLRDELIGFSRKMMAVPLIVIAKDRNGRQFLIGTLVSPAYISNFQLQSGKKFDDDSAAVLKVSSNASLFEYKNVIPVIEPDPETGDFDYNFDTDFD